MELNGKGILLRILKAEILKCFLNSGTVLRVKPRLLETGMPVYALKEIQ
jgi:hypothetical protein